MKIQYKDVSPGTLFYLDTPYFLKIKLRWGHLDLRERLFGEWKPEAFVYLLTDEEIREEMLK